MPARRAYSDAEIEAAIQALADPARLEEAQRIVGANVPRLQAAGKPAVDDRMTAVRTLIAEETSVSMLIGVAVGYELAHELMQREE